ncbi:hypothetical protein ACROYT_G012073, partial [Oculina patagonica]
MKDVVLSRNGTHSVINVQVFPESVSSFDMIHRNTTCLGISSCGSHIKINYQYSFHTVIVMYFYFLGMFVENSVNWQPLVGFTYKYLMFLPYGSSCIFLFLGIFVGSSANWQPG